MLELCHIRRRFRQIVDGSQSSLEHARGFRILDAHDFDWSCAGRTPANEHARRRKSGEHRNQRDAARRRYVLSGGIVPYI
jgi:hypothetical protein